MKLLLPVFLLAQLTLSAEGFEPFEAWKAAVLAGDKTALTRIYSSIPPATAMLGKTKVPLDQEILFWAGSKAAGVQLNPKVLEVVTPPGSTNVLLRIEGTKDGRKMVASMQQVWVRQLDGWHIVISKRGDFAPTPARTLPEPAKPNTALYAEPSEAQAELNAALQKAGLAHKRVIVVFGGNWCYDCHVLDTTFRSAAFASLVNANYEVVHINVGDDGKANNDLAARLGVALDKGVPALGVLDPDGSVVYAQKNGEFESTVKIGPADVRAFLEKWKPTLKK